MSDDETLLNVQYVGNCPYNEKREEIQINPTQARFILPRQKTRKDYQAVFDAQWNEVVSFEVSEVHYCKDGETWPLDEELLEGMKPIGTSGIVFLHTVPFGRAVFPIWSTIPAEDVPTVRELIEEHLDRPSLPGLAHHGTAAAVKYILDRCEILTRMRGEFYDWLKKGRMAKPNKKFRERGPDYVFCKEGMAIDFYGAGEQLEQMSTFWPWRLMHRVVPDNEELSIKYQWKEDAYIFEQQVLDDDMRHLFYQEAEKALEAYRASEGVNEYLLIRPWSFPSRFHRTWDKLEPFSSKASRNRFPPITEFTEEI
jgi:hypothetical protein